MMELTQPAAATPQWSALQTSASMGAGVTPPSAHLIHSSTDSCPLHLAAALTMELNLLPTF